MTRQGLAKALGLRLDQIRVICLFVGGALGAKGAGEIGVTGVAVAIANAVYHATGRRIRSLPITPEALL